MPFVAAFRLICYVAQKAVDGMVSVRIISAEDWPDARQQALEVGRGLEVSYTNADGKLVEWRLAQVMTLDELQPGSLIGREVYAYRIAPAADELDPQQLDPANRSTGQTGI
jgi:Domain of unknown function (DUF4288)